MIVVYLLAGIGALSVLAAAGFLGWTYWIGRRLERAGLFECVRYRVTDAWGNRLYSIEGRSEAEIAERFLMLCGHPGVANPLSDEEMRRLLGGGGLK